MFVLLLSIVSLVMAEEDKNGYIYKKPLIPFGLPTFAPLQKKSTLEISNTGNQIPINKQPFFNSPKKIESGSKIHTESHVTTEKEQLSNSPLKSDDLSNHNQFHNNKANYHVPTHIESNHSGPKVTENYSKFNTDFVSNQKVCNEELHSSSFTTQVGNTIDNEPDLEHVLNQNGEAIYRLAIEPTKLIQKHKNHKNNNNNDVVKRLKLKNIKYNVTQFCCEQTNESLNATFAELSRNRPLERRLTPYKETIVEEGYFY